MGGRPPRSIALVGLALTLVVGCRGGPTLEEAQALLRAGDAEGALELARRASARAPAEERVALRRFALQAALAAGLPREGAREYQLLRRLTGREDDGLLAELAGAVLRRAVAGDDPARRVRGAEALVLLGDDPRAAALLRTALADHREEVRAQALATAAQGEPSSALPLLAAAARGDASGWVRRRAVEHLTALLEAREVAAQAAEVLSGVAEASLADTDEDVRVAGVRLLARACDRARAIDGLAREVGRGSDAVRCAAALELLRLDPAAAARAWSEGGLPVSASDPVGALGLALQAHAPAPDEGTLDAVRDALRAPAYRVRLMAARGLAGPGAPRVVAALREVAVADPVQPVRGAALEALVAGAPEAARAACRAALDHVDPATRRCALEGLERLGALAPGEHAPLLRDPALADLSARWLATRGGEPGFQALVRALDDPVGARPALDVLADQGDRRMRRRFVDLLTAPERVDAAALRAAARGLARCGDPADRSLLLAMLMVPDDHVDVVAAASLLFLQGRLALTAPVATAE